MTRVAKRGLAGRPATQPEINRFRRASLIRAALEVVAREGIENTTIARICAGANVSSGLAAHYFENKEDLLAQAFARLLDDVSEATGRAAARVEGPKAKLLAIYSTVFSDDVYSDVARSAYLTFWAASLTSPVLLEINRAAYLRFHAAIEGLFARAAAEAGVAIDARAAAIGLNGLSDGLWLDLSIGVDDFTRADAIRACSEFVENALAPRQQGQRRKRKGKQI